MPLGLLGIHNFSASSVHVLKCNTTINPRSGAAWVRNAAHFRIEDGVRRRVFNTNLGLQADNRFRANKCYDCLFFLESTIEIGGSQSASVAKANHLGMVTSPHAGETTRTSSMVVEENEEASAPN